MPDPVPFCPPVIVIQLALAVAVQLHVAGAVIANVPVSEPGPWLRLLGFRGGARGTVGDAYPQTRRTGRSYADSKGDWRDPTRRRKAENWTRKLAHEVTEFILLHTPELDATPSLDFINLENGILDVWTGKLFPHSPKVLSTIRIPITFECASELPTD